MKYAISVERLIALGSIADTLTQERGGSNTDLALAM